MLRSQEVLRARYTFSDASGRVNDQQLSSIYIARMQGSPEVVVARHADAERERARRAAVDSLAAQVMIMREGRGVDREPLTQSQIIGIMEGDGQVATYVANGSLELRLHNCLAYCMVRRPAQGGLIEITEGAVRDIPGMRQKRYTRAVAAMFRPLLEDCAPVPGDPESLEGVRLSVYSPAPSARGIVAMEGLGLEQTPRKGFVGNAAQVYVAIGELNIQKLPILGPQA